MAVLGWDAFYTGGRHFSDLTSEWEDLPKIGVLSVAVHTDKVAGEYYAIELLSGKRRYFLAQGSKNYFIKGTLWQEKTILDTYDTSSDKIKEGIWDDDDSYDEALKLATSLKRKV